MIDTMIAQVATDGIVVGVVAGAGVIGVFGLTIKHVTNRPIHLGSKKFTDEKLCDERHERIERQLQAIEDKLDFMRENLIKKKS